ncbi:hypothetical protein HKCCE3408_11445 [Rhodobacterales bacterium HKCCE3408]|nr:hypothetical protein [Rhodobacterales bacterium HKCCE3408]
MKRTGVRFFFSGLLIGMGAAVLIFEISVHAGIGSIAIGVTGLLFGTWTALVARERNHANMILLNDARSDLYKLIEHGEIKSNGDLYNSLRSAVQKIPDMKGRVE